MMLAHDIVGNKEDELKIYVARETVQFTIGVRYMVWFVKQILIKHTAENLDKWIQVATIKCQYYKFIAFGNSTDSTHKLIIIMTT